jgi:methylenetetrahydrofolate--tRNA-(uracil-5-)-methyltransferase
MLPGLGHAEFVRYGRMHRNSYLNAPLILNQFSQFKKRPNIYIAGQLSGVEGYLESVASGLLAALFACLEVSGGQAQPLPASTACGALLNYLAHADWQNFRPTKFNFGLLESEKIKMRDKKGKKEQQARNALRDLAAWKSASSI